MYSVIYLFFSILHKQALLRLLLKLQVILYDFFASPFPNWTVFSPSWAVNISAHLVFWCVPCLSSGPHCMLLHIQGTLLGCSWFWPREHRLMLWTTVDALLWWLLLPVDRPELLVCVKQGSPLKCFCFFLHLETFKNYLDYLELESFFSHIPQWWFLLINHFVPLLHCHVKTPTNSLRCSSLGLLMFTSCISEFLLNKATPDLTRVDFNNNTALHLACSKVPYTQTNGCTKCMQCHTNSCMSVAGDQFNIRHRRWLEM